jgi:hypothetical protein
VVARTKGPALKLILQLVVWERTHDMNEWVDKYH